MRSGGIRLIGVDGATFWRAGWNGYDWSSRGSSTSASGNSVPSVYRLQLNDDGVYPSNGPDHRWYAFPLRCLSTVLDI